LRVFLIITYIIIFKKTPNNENPTRYSKSVSGNVSSTVYLLKTNNTVVTI